MIMLMIMMMMMLFLVIRVLIRIMTTIIKLLKPGVILAENDDKEEESSEKWSDRSLMNKYGKMTAIGIEEEERGYCIQKIRARCLFLHLL